MKIIDIQPVTFWIDGVNEIADQICLYNFHGYNFDGSDSLVSYKVGWSELLTDGETVVFHSYGEGSVSIPDSVVQSWGADDDPIIDFVLTTLNLEAI